MEKSIALGFWSGALVGNWVKIQCPPRSSMGVRSETDDLATYAVQTAEKSFFVAKTTTE
jgi:hypothetical protein